MPSTAYQLNGIVFSWELWFQCAVAESGTVWLLPLARCVFSPQAHQELETLEEEMGQMQDRARLFEVTLPEYKHMKQCRREIQLLKGLWDAIIYVTVRWSLGQHGSLY